METNPANLAPQTGAAFYHQQAFLGSVVSVLAVSLIVILSALLAVDRLVVTALLQPASTASPAAGQPLSLTGSLRRYLEQGARVQYCQPTWSSSSNNSASLCQYLGPAFVPMVPPARLAPGDVALVQFSASRLSLSSLIADWGTPTIVHLADGEIALTWHHQSLGLTAWLTWGDPHRVPASAILRLSGPTDMSRD